MRVAGELRSAREDLQKLIERSKQIDDDEGAKEQLDEVVEQLEASQEKLKQAMESLGPFGR
jgi:DNA-binding transcriptional regulator GbsR (MarR family)